MRFEGASKTVLAAMMASVVTGCASTSSGPVLPPATFVSNQQDPGEQYLIGPLDQLTIFVWRNPELGAKVQVRPDGRITTPLIADLPATGKTPAQLADDIKVALSKYVSDPLVSVMVDNFSGTFSQQIRVVGATDKPASLPYRANMTLLDAMIAVGGLSQYAAGDRAKLVRYDKATGKQHEYPLKIARLVKHGDVKANVKLEPGDVIIIPESMF
ncbi:XrtA/PEP-CTERM system exopolysaccharide export protein [Sphingomonas abietis]|uniref:Polysaccharide export protein n=1 Tax=Sphingomonas abietis TaxID=3012344 RepID=A0ABY7NRF2_9SPHN|nr:XrtA/PEP-CTERM system exopolysaccharide export protein [Sphingomonas abietis]WBO24115.1 polysaccharide export protein [Sphingomonas abietis]